MSKSSTPLCQSQADRWFEDHVDRIAQRTRFRNPTPVVSFVDAAPMVEWVSRETDEATTQVDVEAVRRQRIDTPDGPIWVEGDALLCVCPECHAPISMRLYLAMANCWRCQECVELTPAQVAAVQHWQRQAPRSAEPAVQPAANRPATAIAAAVPQRRRTIEPNWEVGPRRPRRTLRDRVNSIPAWLVSLLLHLALLLILALILLPQDVWDEGITITTFLSRVDQPGGELRAIQIDHTLQDDLLPEPLLEMSDRELREFKVRAENDARELLVDDTPLAQRPDLEAVKQSITTQSGPTRSLAARDPRLRADIVQMEGGSTLTEAAVSRGLRWLASVQNEDGSWSLQNYDRHDRPNNRGDSAATALALLPFLGAGQTHEIGVYKTTVAKGLQWLLTNQDDDGDLRAGLTSNAGMYAHGQATIDLIEAYAMTGDERLREPAQRAICFIEDAQHRNGGWRYEPRQAGDTSVLGWQLMALQSARMSGSGLEVDSATLKLADYYLDMVSEEVDDSEISVDDKYRRAGVLYRYQRDHEPTPAMTAEGLLCRMYLGWQRDDPRMRLGIDWLTRYHTPEESGEFNLYYWYYAVQVMHHYGGSSWDTWNQQLRDSLVLTQISRGKYAGSWDPDDDYWASRGGGRIFSTAMAVCILEVYYRHLPLFKQLELQ